VKLGIRFNILKEMTFPLIRVPQDYDRLSWLDSAKLDWFGTVFHGDASHGVGGTSPTFPTHPGRGDAWGNVSPCTPFGETQGDTGGFISPMWGSRFPKRGVSGRLPSKMEASGRTPSKGGLLGIPPKFFPNKT
jgi:hypothetical protein